MRIYQRLEIEKIRYGITDKRMGEVLGCTTRTISNKMNGITPLSMAEKTKLRDACFPGVPIDDLFRRYYVDPNTGEVSLDE